MQNQDNKFEVLIEHASLSLDKSEEEIKISQKGKRIQIVL